MESSNKIEATNLAHLKDGLIDLTAGTLGGIANVYAGQPLDTVKVKIQTFPHLYKNWIKCFTETFKLDGIRGLYAGTIPALTASVAENAVLFTAYGFCQKSVAFLSGKHDVEKMNPVENAFSGSLAAFFAALVLCPTELVAREIPGYFFFFGAYETARYYLTPSGKAKDEIGLWRTALAGGIGGMALWATIFPADVVKSRMQVSGKGSFTSTIMLVYKEGGVKSFYKGLVPTLIRTFSASGCLFIAFEYSKKLLHSIV